MNPRKIHVLEQKLLNAISSRKLEEVKACVTAIKECKDNPAPSIDVQDPSDEYFPTPLMKAAAIERSESMVKLLLDNGANKSLTNVKGETVKDIINRSVEKDIDGDRKSYRW